MAAFEAPPGPNDQRKPSAAHWISADLPAEQDTGPIGPRGYRSVETVTEWWG